MTAVTHVRVRIRRDIRWALIVIVAVQAILSARLIWSNTAFQDEALYIWAGHTEFAHWFFGKPEPDFPAYFSGAPVIYPLLAAIADSFGGLAGARMVSLLFMLGATVLLWGTTARLYGRRSALAAAGLWSVLGPVIRLGAFATYDAMSLFLVALAAWLATSGRGKQDATPRIIAAAAALTLANATKYATVIFDPAVIAIAIAAGYPVPGGKPAWRRGALLGYWVVVATIVLLQFGQGEYLSGIDSTTLERPAGAATTSAVLGDSLTWVGLILALAAGALAIALRDKVNRIVIGALLATGLLVPLWQAKIHTMTSLNKHVAFGAWFAAIAVGYGADRVVTWLSAKSAARAAQRITRQAAPGAGRPSPLLRLALRTAVPLSLVPLAAIGMRQAESFFAWPGVGNLIPVLRTVATPDARYLADTTTPLQYYLPDTTWRQWTSLATDPAQAKTGLAHHAYALVIEDSTDDINATGYRQVATVPYSGPDHRGSYRILEYVG
jgi:4-amino-4-deoxy-L-arabinose transferase-like glycosyltransferase